MNILLWVLQLLAALLYAASGIMKVFMFDKVSEGPPDRFFSARLRFHSTRSSMP